MSLTHYYLTFVLFQSPVPDFALPEHPETIELSSEDDDAADDDDEELANRTTAEAASGASGGGKSE